MREINTEELKKIQLEILDFTSDFCEKNGINYWLDGGTLIGAIRHGGYIPWDDDIDIGMLREDFIRFFNEFNKSNERYVAKTIDVNKDFTYACGKVLDTQTILYEPDESGNKISVNIDVFVYDNAPDNESELKKFYDKRDFYRKLNNLRTSVSVANGRGLDGISKKIAKFILKPFPKNYFAIKFSNNAKRYNSMKCDSIGNFVGYARFRCNKRVFNSFPLHEFEGKQYRIPVGYDEYLTQFYGDYMQLPPVEERVSHHTFKAYIND